MRRICYAKIWRRTFQAGGIASAKALRQRKNPDMTEEWKECRVTGDLGGGNRSGGKPELAHEESCGTRKEFMKTLLSFYLEGNML